MNTKTDQSGKTEIETKKEKKKSTLLKSFFFFIRGSRATIVAAMLTMTLGVAINYFMPQITRITIDNILGDDEIKGWAIPFVEFLGGREYLRSHLYIIGGLIVLMTLFIATFAYLRRMFALDSAEKIGKRIRDTMYSRIQSLPFSWHAKIQTGDIIQRTTQDSDLIKRYISNQFIEIFRLIAMMSVGLTMMFSMNVRMTFIAMSFLVAALVFSLSYFPKIAKTFLKAEIEEGKMTALLQENLTGLRVVRAFGKQADEDRNYRNKNRTYSYMWIDFGKRLSIFWGSGDMFAAFQTFAILIIGTFMSVRGLLTVGELLAFISYNQMLIWPIRNLGRVLAETGRVKTSIERLEEILNAEPEPELPHEIEIPIKGEIEFRNACFSYDGSRKILDDISFKIPAGSVFGIIGATGSGKSTVVQLINRLYDVTDGGILIDGVDVRNIKRRHLRKNIGIVLQEPFLFSRKINENILIATEAPDFTELEKYTAIASLDSTIAEFTEGYDTIVGEKGVTLSGGQKQRIVIARTLIQRPPVVIFDDSLSAVDMDTDQKIRQAISENVKGTTVILISHRITSLMHADQIMVLDNGRIENIGSHAQLVRTEGTYKRLYDLQTNAGEEVFDNEG